MEDLYMRARGMGPLALGDRSHQSIAPCVHESKVGLGSGGSLCMGGARKERKERISI